MSARRFGKTRAAFWFTRTEATVARFAAAGKARFNSAFFHTTVARAAFVCGHPAHAACEFCPLAGFYRSAGRCCVFKLLYDIGHGFGPECVRELPSFGFRRNSARIRNDAVLGVPCYRREAILRRRRRQVHLFIRHSLSIGFLPIRRNWQRHSRRLIQDAFLWFCKCGRFLARI